MKTLFLLILNIALFVSSGHAIANSTVTWPLGPGFLC